MTHPHVIRLRDPWQCEPVRAELPRAPDDPQLVRCTRQFNAPTNLDPQARVWLVRDAVDFRASFDLNDHHLGTIEGRRPQPRIDITDALRPHNRLVIEIELAPDAPLPGPGARFPLGLPGGIGGVHLEIARHVADWKIDKLDQR